MFDRVIAFLEQAAEHVYANNAEVFRRKNQLGEATEQMETAQEYRKAAEVLKSFEQKETKENEGGAEKRNE